MILFASDLDNTLIYSYKKNIGQKVLVEKKEGKELSYMTNNAYEKLEKLIPYVLFVPVTTRSVEQYERIHLMKSGVPQYALASNGGILLKNGEIDRRWYEESRDMIKDALDDLAAAKEILRGNPDLLLDIRLVDGLFLFTKIRNPEEKQKMLQEKLGTGRVSVYLNGEKLYVVPDKLNKGEAIQRLKTISDVSYTVAGGDSLFDVPMLLQADLAVFPEHLNTGLLKRHQKNKIVESDQYLSDALLDCVKERLVGGK